MSTAGVNAHADWSIDCTWDCVLRINNRPAIGAAFFGVARALPQHDRHTGVRPHRGVASAQRRRSPNRPKSASSGRARDMSGNSFS
jgi:hypothetical protein